MIWTRRVGALVAAGVMAWSGALAEMPVPSVKPPPPSAAAPPVVAPVSPAATPETGIAACRASLTADGVVFRAVEDASQGDCKLDGAVALEGIATRSGVVTLDGAPVMLCSLALPLSAWVRDVAAPIAVAQMGSPLQRIEIGTGFACRNRYGKTDAKISEHARGNAIDIAAVVLASKRRIEIGAVTAEEDAAFLRGIRTSACGYFTTVLGPGSNPAHADHLHLDLGQHGRSANYRICE